MTRASCWCVGIILVGTLACGGGAPNAPTPAAPAVEPAKQGLVITWGLTGVYFLYSGAGTPPLPPYDNLVMLRNFIRRLGEGRGLPGSFRILYTTRRSQASITDPQNRRLYGPFLDVTAPLGTVDFNVPSRVALSSYTVVIFDPCDNPDEVEIVRSYVSGGGRALVLGDNFCHQGTTPSAEISNRIVSGFGITFTREDPAKRDPLSISFEEQSVLFEGVRQVSVFRVTPQVLSGTAVALLRDGASVLSAMATIDPR